jgi:hypothetical protein
MKTQRLAFYAWALVAFSFFLGSEVFSQGTIRYIKQEGQGIRLQMDNRGTFGRAAYPGGTNSSFPRDSLGLEYPLGSSIEHMYGGGIWIGALVDTSTIPGTNPRVKAVTTAYEGWAGPLWEMAPCTDNDVFWRASRFDTVAPPGWTQYWGSALPFRPISDNDIYCLYTDYCTRPSNHVPLGIKVIESSYAWKDPYADGIIINEYRIINTTDRSLEQAYIGFFADADVGPATLANYWLRNFTGYDRDSRTAYIHNPDDRGSTPVGITLAYPEPDTAVIHRYTFRWFPGPNTPPNDAGKYDLMGSGIIDPDEYPARSDTRFVFAFGPFRITARDTLKIGVGVICAPNIFELKKTAKKCLYIYKNKGIQLPATPPPPPLRVDVGFRRVTLNWRWQPGDERIFGPEYTDPEANWDTASIVARWEPQRYRSGEQWVRLANGDSVKRVFKVPPGLDSTRGGRNFEAYRIWRSENPLYPDASFTLLKQFDVIGKTDSTKFEYETGLEYTFVDSNLVRGKTYVYAVTSKSIPDVVETLVGGDTVRVQVDALESSKRKNAVRVDLPFAVSKELGKVSVVPNPYRTDQDYKLENGGYEGLTSRWTENERRIKFINLPEKCTIRIFSLAGDLVRTVRHDGGGGTFPRGDEDVLLVSETNRALASGIYIFTVESDLGVQTGKFVIIR